MVNKILKFSAEWCNPCKLMKTMLKDYDAVPVIEYDIEENDDLVNKYKIRSVPTLVLVDENNEALVSKTGIVSISDLDELINKYNG